MKTNASPWHSYALLVLFKKHLLIFLLILLTIGFNSCKKDLLVNKLPQANINKEKIKSISYNEFLSSINLEKTGVLKASLSNAGKVGHGKLMNNNLGSNALAFDTDSVKKLKLGDTVSYVISLKPETPHAVQFRNLTIQLLNKKTTAFLTTYLPTQEFVKAYKLNKKTSFKGEIFVNKILLEELPQITGLSTVKNNSNGKLMSLNANDVLLNNNKISLAPGECEIYDVYVTTWLPCFEGHETRDPGDCNYFTTYNTWDLVNNWDYPPGFYDVYSSTVVNCAPPSTGSGDGGGTGGGVTTPNPPGGYDPCDCETPTVSAVGENKGGLKLAVGAPNCCDEGGGGGLPPIVIDEPESNPDNGLDISDLGTDGSGQDMNYSIYFDDIEGDFKAISKSDPNYNNVINNGTTSLPIDFAPCTTQALRQMGRDKGWDVGVSPLEFNRRVGQAFQEAVFKLYKQKLLPPQRLRVKYQPQNNNSAWRANKAGNTSQVIPDWTYDMNLMGISAPFSQHWFYDAKAVTGTLYLSTSKYQIGGYIDVLSKKKVPNPNVPPPALIFVTPVNTIISPSIIATAISKGVQIRQAFVIIINNQLYLLNSIELTPTNDRFTNIPTNLLKILSGPVDLELPINPNNGPDFEEVQ